MAKSGRAANRAPQRGRSEEPEIELVIQGPRMSLSDHTKLCLDIVDVGGVLKLNARVWYNTRSDDTLKPTGKGFMLDLPRLAGFIRQLNKLLDRAEKKGMEVDQ